MKHGRPKKFDKPEELAILIEKYFNSITITEPKIKYEVVGYEDEEKKKPIYEETPLLNNNGDQVMEDRYFEHPTIGNMCIYLGIARSTLFEYEKINGFSNTIKNAKSIIEAYVEQQLFREKGHTGLIFNLKNNFGWVDKQEVQHSGGVKQEIKYNNLSDEELTEELNKYE